VDYEVSRPNVSNVNLAGLVVTDDRLTSRLSCSVFGQQSEQYFSKFSNDGLEVPHREPRRSQPRMFACTKTIRTCLFVELSANFSLSETSGDVHVSRTPVHDGRVDA